MDKNTKIENEIMTLLAGRDKNLITTHKDQLEHEIEQLGGAPAEIIASLMSQGKIAEVTNTLIFPVHKSITLL